LCQRPIDMYTSVPMLAAWRTTLSTMTPSRGSKVPPAAASKSISRGRGEDGFTLRKTAPPTPGTPWLFVPLNQVKRRAGLSPFPASFERG